ncbi:MAG TPA: excinuclease ABC subunit UvrA [Gemmatimonadales bacterium]|nr:excinuclease ABC subunit UvrA [Gemmatimonadales bacterium]
MVAAAPVIRVVNARQHNLKGVTVDLPRRALIVVTGPSGSGKSSLAFDTLYAEGQRRYIESLSTYAKQFLERMPKPLVDRLEGLAPAVAIEQRNPAVSSRSTVGTATEVYDYLRLLWARVGRQTCRACGHPVRRDTPHSAAQDVLRGAAGRIQVTFPLPPTARQSHEAIVENLRALGFVRVQVGESAWHLDQLPAGLDLAAAPELLVVVDRLTLDAGPGGSDGAPPAPPGRLVEALATAFAEGEGVALVLHEGGRLRFTERPACSRCDTPAAVVTPALFSFNNPRGACRGCNGFGAVLEYDESLIVPDPRRSLAEGAIAPWTKPRYEARRRLLLATARALGADPDRPWESLKPAHRRELLYGRHGRYVGIFPFLKSLEDKRYKQYVRVFLRQYQLARPCPLCHGARLNEDALAVRVAGETIAAVAARPVDQLAGWLDRLALTDFERQVSHLVLEQLRRRLGFLRDVGLGYLTLDRLTRTLSGGEAQRIALANALGANLVDALYVLDEPSIGLHPRDIDRLLALLARLRDQGNTVIVVEHDPAAIRKADFMLELGPGAGEHGGRVVYAGPVAGATGSLTGQYLQGLKRIGVPSVRRRAAAWLQIRGATLHNLRGVDADIPLGTLTAVTGVSGSGKSTLVHDVLYRQLEARLKGGHSAKEHLGETVGRVTALHGAEHLDDVLLLDQSPIGRTPRSNPITYVKGFDDIRALFAAQPEARRRRYTAASFSFNMPGGRCEACEGAGAVLVEMVFLADVYVPCEVCGGSRYKREILDVRLHGYSIAEVLQFTVDEAIRRFRHQPRLGQALWHLQQVGLGYLRLGQPATTLSGGEAQRLKIARELAQAGRRAGRKLYLLDEPTTGLHLDDVRVLIQVLDRLVDAGHTVVVIEHHLDVIKRADWVIDLGPEAGDQGGRVVAQGTPEQVAQVEASHTGRYLREVLAPAAALAG